MVFPSDYKRIYPEFDVRICGSITAETFGRMYAVNYGYDPQDTATKAIRLANMMGGDLVWIKDGDTWISFAGAMYLAIRLNEQGAMNRLVRMDGDTQ